tara:strand:+ start:1007 stop:1465 length:459 start_codon:yes stop_codon:yes gene_type:complete
MLILSYKNNTQAIYTSDNVSANIAQNLKKTENPKYKKVQSNIESHEPDKQTAVEEQPTEKQNKQTSNIERISSKYNIHDYTPKGQNDKRDEFIFNKNIHYNQSSDSRARLLNSMYSDLLNESVKKDPYMRKTGETGCEMTRGTKTTAYNNDC